VGATTGNYAVARSATLFLIHLAPRPSLIAGWSSSSRKRRLADSCSDSSHHGRLLRNMSRSICVSGHQAYLATSGVVTVKSRKGVGPHLLLMRPHFGSCPDHSASWPGSPTRVASRAGSATPAVDGRCRTKAYPQSGGDLCLAWDARSPKRQLRTSSGSWPSQLQRAACHSCQPPLAHKHHACIC
jgi:hypothetical protein